MGKIVYDGWHKIELMEAEIKGKIVKREKLLVKSAVAAVVIDCQGAVALVKQYRPCTGETLYELPAGVIDKDLTPKEIMIEELEEECELDRNLLSFTENTTQYYMLAGSTDATTTIFKVHYDEMGKDKVVNDAEVEEVVWFTPDKLSHMLYSGQIKDSKTIIGLMNLIR